MEELLDNDVIIELKKGRKDTIDILH